MLALFTFKLKTANKTLIFAPPIYIPIQFPFIFFFNISFSLRITEHI